MSSDLPHEKVYVRLRLSALHGIGVFAIERIPKGTNLFANDQVDLVWVDKTSLDRARLTPAQRAFYHDFGIARGDTIGCPVNFNNLTPGWYLNEPALGEKPNVDVDQDLHFLTCRDIEQGEELTIRYTQFSDAPDG
jgi:hypothetical protein